MIISDKYCQIIFGSSFSPLQTKGNHFRDVTSVKQPDDYNRRYHPLFSSGSLHRFIKRDRRIYIQNSCGGPKVTRTIFTGRIADIILNARDETGWIKAFEGWNILEQPIRNTN